jgi:hypothetical protein
VAEHLPSRCEAPTPVQPEKRGILKSQARHRRQESKATLRLVGFGFVLDSEGWVSCQVSLHFNLGVTSPRLALPKQGSCSNPGKEAGGRSPWVSLHQGAGAGWDGESALFLAVFFFLLNIRIIKTPVLLTHGSKGL